MQHRKQASGHKWPLFIMAAALLLPLYSFGQSSLYHEEYNLSTGIRAKNDEPDRTIICFFGGSVYTLMNRAAFQGDEIRMTRFDTQSRQAEQIVIRKRPDTKALFGKYILALAVTEHKLFVLTGQSIFVLKKEGATYRLTKTIPNEGSFTRLYPLSSTELLCYVNYNFHPMDEPDKHSWAKLSIANDSLGAEKHMDEDNVLFSYFVNEWLSTYKGLIAYAHTTDYSIRLYNDRLELFDSIRSNTLQPNREKLALFPKGKQHSVDEMNAIRRLDDSLLTRIEKIFLLDSTHLLVTIKQAQSDDLRFDLWAKINNTWSLHQTMSREGFYTEGKAYTAENNTLSGFAGNFNGLVYAGKGDFYYYYYPYVKNITTPAFDKQKDYHDLINRLSAKNSLYYGLKKIRIHFNE